MPPLEDQNHVKIKYALSYVDGTTVVPIVIDSANGGVKVDTTHSISFDPETLVWWGEKYWDTPIWLAQSTVTGHAIPIFADPVTGGILIATS